MDMFSLFLLSSQEMDIWYIYISSCSLSLPLIQFNLSSELPVLFKYRREDNSLPNGAAVEKMIERKDCILYSGV